MTARHSEATHGNESGQSVIEYALVVALVSLVIVGLLTSVASGAMTTLADRIAGALT